MNRYILKLPLCTCF